MYVVVVLNESKDWFHFNPN